MNKKKGMTRLAIAIVFSPNTYNVRRNFFPVAFALFLFLFLSICHRYNHFVQSLLFAIQTIALILYRTEIISVNLSKSLQ